MRPLFGGPGAHLAHAQGSQLSEKLAVPLSRQRSVSITAAQPSYGTGADEPGARRSSLPVQQSEPIRHLAQLGAPSLTPSEGREERATCILDVEDEQYSSDEEQPLVLLYEEQPIQEGARDESSALTRTRAARPRLTRSVHARLRRPYDSRVRHQVTKRLRSGTAMCRATCGSRRENRTSWRGLRTRSRRTGAWPGRRCRQDGEEPVSRSRPPPRRTRRLGAHTLPCSDWQLQSQ